MRAKYQSAKDQGIYVKELDDLIELPDTMSYVWIYFSDLHNSRSNSGFGINPLSYSDILAYYKLFNLIPNDWEIRAIKRLDNIALDQYAKEAEKEQKKIKAKSKN